MKALLDTHVLIWWPNDRERLSSTQREVVGSVRPEMPLLVSDISLREVAMLHGLERIRLAIPLREWLDKATAPPLVQRQGVSPRDCGGSSGTARFLPPRPRRSDSGGNRPGARRDAADTGPQNRRRGTGGYLELSGTVSVASGSIAAHQPSTTIRHASRGRA